MYSIYISSTKHCGLLNLSSACPSEQGIGKIICSFLFVSFFPFFVTLLFSSIQHIKASAQRHTVRNSYLNPYESCRSILQYPWPQRRSEMDSRRSVSIRVHRGPLEAARTEFFCTCVRVLEVILFKDIVGNKW